MIAFLRGEVAQKSDGKIILDVNGVGYEMLVSNTTLSSVGQDGQTTTIFTYMQVSEHAVNLIGFSSREEKNLFELLITVNGVGPKGALSVLSALPLSDLVVAIASGDAVALSRAKGLGKKIAERIVLELQSKVSPLGVIAECGSPTAVLNTDAMDEAYAVLLSLGLTKNEALKLVKANSAGSDSAEEIVQKVLRDMGR